MAVPGYGTVAGLLAAMGGVNGLIASGNVDVHESSDGGIFIRVHATPNDILITIAPGGGVDVTVGGLGPGTF